MDSIRRIRTIRGMTQLELAEASGIAQHTISQLENGRNSPRAVTLHRLAGALGVGVEDFFTEGFVPKAPRASRRAPDDAPETARGEVEARLALKFGAAMLQGAKDQAGQPDYRIEDIEIQRRDFGRVMERGLLDPSSYPDADDNVTALLTIVRDTLRESLENVSTVEEATGAVIEEAEAARGEKA